MKTQTLILYGVGAFAGALALSNLVTKKAAAAAPAAGTNTGGDGWWLRQNEMQQSEIQAAIAQQWDQTFGGGFDPWSGWQPGQ